MKKYYIAAVAAALVLTACSQAPSDSAPSISNNTTPAESAPSEAASQPETTITETGSIMTPSGYTFTPFSNVQLYMHMEASAVLDALGEPLSFMEAPSCAFQGTDRIYGFGSYEITTYEKDGKEYIYDIYFLDDSVTTDEGIYIGCTKADMEAAYGTSYEEASGSYTYKKDGMTLQFLTENDTIIAIRYNGAGQ